MRNTLCTVCVVSFRLGLLPPVVRVLALQSAFTTAPRRTGWCSSLRSAARIPRLGPRACADKPGRHRTVCTPTTMAEHAAKRQKLARAAEPLVGTHNGTFHCDEALAVYLLRKTAPFEHARECPPASAEEPFTSEIPISRCVRPRPVPCVGIDPFVCVDRWIVLDRPGPDTRP